VSRHTRGAFPLKRMGWPLAGVAVLAVVAAAATVAVVRQRPPRSVATLSVPGGASPAQSPATAVASDPAAAASGAPASPSRPPPPSGAAAPARFATIPAGRPLPSGTQCGVWVRARPYPENKRANARANQTTGHPLGGALFTGDDPRANTTIASRVDGQFTGTTREILRWAACKWGVDEDLVMAQAAVESWWLQNTLGDWTGDAARCAPGRGPGVDGRAGQCPESFGILQNRYPYEKPAWPGIANSTAMNADVAYAIWRTCFEGYETWLNTVERGRDYAAGDAWGCVGRWFSGRWQVPASTQYAAKVRDQLDRRVWETPDFQQP
jgi:hypothetical protein